MEKGSTIHSTHNLSFPRPVWVFFHLFAIFLLFSLCLSLSLCFCSYFILFFTDSTAGVARDPPSTPTSPASSASDVNSRRSGNKLQIISSSEYTQRLRGCGARAAWAVAVAVGKSWKIAVKGKVEIFENFFYIYFCVFSHTTENV